MDRVTGSYKRWAKRWVIVIAVVVVCVGNLDSIAIARSLYASSAVRATVVQRASDQNFCSTPADPTRCAEEAANLLERTGIPLGLVEAQSRRWNLGLASEDPRPADLGRGGSARCAILVSLAGSDRIAAQYGAPTRTWLLARSSCWGRDV